MPDGGFGILAGAAKTLKSLVKPLLDLLGRPRVHADAELRDLSVQLTALLAMIDESAVNAHIATNGSPNDPQAQTASQEALQQSWKVGQKLATLFNFYTVSHTPQNLVDTRLRYRELVTDERNLDAMDPEERSRRCHEIEVACVAFHAAVRDEAFNQWGIGLGHKAGRLQGRKLPK